jgi:hypothetical protein
MAEESTQDDGKPARWEGRVWESGLEAGRGKPAVRNFREGDGNVGIIRSPVRAIVLPDSREAQARNL